MTSERKIAANRGNARVGRGPKTIQGKRRSSKNALRHGLSLPVSNVASVLADIEALAREIVGGGTDDPCVVGIARHIAEAQIDLVRIRTVRHELLNQANMSRSIGGETTDLIEQLTKIGCYERRAFSRRKKALAQLTDLQMMLQIRDATF